jgi:hypothetical protein
LRFIRKVTDKPFWSEELPRRGEDAIERAAAEWTATSLLSVFRVASADEESVIALAISVERGSQSKNAFHFVEIPEEIISALEIPIYNNPGTTQSPEANALHRDLDVQGRAVALIEALLEQNRGLTVRSMTKAQLKAAAKQLQPPWMPQDFWLLR